MYDNPIIKTHNFQLCEEYASYKKYICDKCKIKITIANSLVLWESNTNNWDILPCDENIIKQIIE